MKRDKINFHIPEGITGKQFEKYLKRTNLKFFFPKKKNDLQTNNKNQKNEMV
jgi:hypothetical protein